MALTPQSNEAFLREVDEALRQDEAVALWRRWGIAIVAAVVLGLIAFAGWLWWQQHRVTVSEDQGVKFTTAMEALGANQPNKATPVLAELAKDGSQGYSALARFTEADIALQKNDLAAAAKKLAEVANNSGAAQPLRDLALVRQTLAEYDTLKPQVVIDRLRPFAVKGNPWFGSAGEMVAIAHLRLGQRDLAGRMFGEMARDEAVPDSIRQRAVQMAGVLGVDAVDQPEVKKAG